MRILKSNFNGSGKLGLNYNRMVHGVNIMCAMPVMSKSRPITGEEEDRRATFAKLAAMGSGFLYAIKLGLKPYAKQMGPLVSPFDAFVSLSSRAVTTMGGETEVDYGSIKIAKGSLPTPGFGNASFATAQKVTGSWSTAVMPGADAQDKVYVVVYEPYTNSAIISSAILRTTGEYEIAMPAMWVGLTVHVFGFAIGDGTTNAGKASDSVYIGTGTIQ